jgi:hypothetical protein
MEWIAIIAAAVILYKNQDKKQPAPPLGGFANNKSMIQKQGKRYPEDTMLETLDKGLKITSYNNALYLQSGNANYLDISRRESGKHITNMAELYNDYAAQLDRKKELSSHIWKKGRISFGYPDRVNQGNNLPWFIVPFIPKNKHNPLSTQPISMFQEI